MAAPKKGESVPAGPIAWNGLVFIGNAGGDRYEGRGRIYALDAITGKPAWETYLVPNDGPPAPNNERMQALARESWGNARGVPVSGGATWTSYTLDPRSEEHTSELQSQANILCPLLPDKTTEP